MDALDALDAELGELGELLKQIRSGWYRRQLVRNARSVMLEQIARFRGEATGLLDYTELAAQRGLDEALFRDAPHGFVFDRSLRWLLRRLDERDVDLGQIWPAEFKTRDDVVREATRAPDIGAYRARPWFAIAVAQATVIPMREAGSHKQSRSEGS